MYFTTQVYDCTQCPHADHDYGECLVVYDEKPIEFWSEDTMKRGRQIYSENCMELTSSCPKMQ